MSPNAVQHFTAQLFQRRKRWAPAEDLETQLESLWDVVWKCERRERKLILTAAILREGVSRWSM